MTAARPFLASLALAATIGTAQADMFRPGIQDQIKLGERAAAQVRKEEKVLPDSDPRVKELRRLGNALVALIPESERKAKPFKYSFDVVDSKEVNAFALPGGPIFFYTGLLDKLETEDQVAGILAHEIVHVRNQHWASAYADNQKRQLGITIALILLDAGRTAFDVAGVADALLFTLPYSRKHETESDTVGYDMVVKAGYNPAGMADVFRLLAKVAGTNKNDEWMSTHPDSMNRVKKIEERIAKSGTKFPPQRPRRIRAVVEWNQGWPLLKLPARLTAPA